MYNIIEQHQNQLESRNESTLPIMTPLNDTKSSPVFITTSGGFKIDCAKECPCGVPVIPVPDQWLEVMVTGGFKVWHIIFIIIAFVITIVVVYCCFHRCRIPRTKQEIEADLMRTNLAQKFSEYLQEFPNEPTTFLEALKKVQELEEKWANEQDDSGAKKRMGWLKLRGKERQSDKTQGAEGVGGDSSAVGKEEDGTDIAPASEQQQASIEDGNKPAIGNKEQSATLNSTDDKNKSGFKDSEVATAKDSLPKELSGEDKIKTSLSSSHKETGTKKPINNLRSVKLTQVSERATTDKERATSNLGPTAVQSDVVLIKAHKSKGEKALERQTTRVKTDIGSAETVQTTVPISEHNVNESSLAASSSTHHQRLKTKRKRDKPNLSRTKAAHVGSIDASTNVLTLPVATTHRRHHNHSEVKFQPQQQQLKQSTTPSSIIAVEAAAPSKPEPRASKLQHPSRTKKQTGTRGDSTFIQIQTDLSPR